MKGNTGSRLYRIHKESGRPWPVLDDDPVVDYMVMEAITLKVQQEEDAAQRKAQLEQDKAEARKRLAKQFG